MNNNLNPKVKAQIDTLLNSIYSLNGPAPDDISASIELFEQKNNLQLPASYKYLLSKIGMDGLCTIFGLSSLENDLEMVNEYEFVDEDYEDEDIDSRNRFLPISGDDCGNLYCIDTITGDLAFWDHEIGFDEEQDSEFPENLCELNDKIDCLIIDFLKEEFDILYQLSKDLTWYVNDKGVAVIPDSVTKIGKGAFSDCSRLVSVTIPDSVTEIGQQAFKCCAGLTSINIPNSVTKIGKGAFNCSGLTSINIPESVTEIGDYAFFGCSGLTSINIPSSVTKIGKGAFYNCTNLTAINIPDSVTEIGDNAFFGCAGLILKKSTM